MLYLKQSTASQSVLIGPFVDATDGSTAETALTIDAADIRLSKNGGNIVGKNSGGGTHDEIGYYTITLDATDTDTVGRLQLMVHESGALPVYHEFWVLEETIYDALFAASAAAFDANQDVTVGSFASGQGPRIRKNVALAGFEFVMTDSTNHAPVTGKTITATRSIDGAAFGSCANSAAEVASGVYKIDLAAGDLNGDMITLRFTATGCDDRLIGIVTNP